MVAVGAQGVTWAGLCPKPCCGWASGVCDLGWVASSYVEEENGRNFLLRQIK